MSKDDWVYVGHMLDMSRQSLDLTANEDKEFYDQHVTLRLALTHLIQMICEIDWPQALKCQLQT